MASCASCPHPHHPTLACNKRSGGTAWACGCLCAVARCEACGRVALPHQTSCGRLECDEALRRQAREERRQAEALEELALARRWLYGDGRERV